MSGKTRSLPRLYQEKRFGEWSGPWLRIRHLDMMVFLFFSLDGIGLSSSVMRLLLCRTSLFMVLSRLILSKIRLLAGAVFLIIYSLHRNLCMTFTVLQPTAVS